MRKGVAICVLIMLVSSPLSSFFAMCAGGYTTWEGAQGGSRTVILIHNVYELQNMSLNLSGSYSLSNDIDACITKNWNSGAGFIPIGNATNPFNGTFEGNGFNISNLYINRSTQEYVGLFGCIILDAYLYRLNILACNITGDNYTGGLLGYSTGTIIGCSSGGLINGARWVGGLGGRVVGGKISDCIFNGSVQGLGYSIGGLIGYNEVNISNCTCMGAVRGFSYRVGGLTGYNLGSITNCSSTASVNGSAELVGGLVGHNDWKGIISDCTSTGSVAGSYMVGGLVGASSRMIFNCTSSGSVIGSGPYVGGLVGSNSNTVSNCTSSGAVISSNNSIGGLIGYNNNGLVSNSYGTGSVIGNSKIGGLVGDNSYGTISNCYSTGNVSGTSNVGGFLGNNIGSILNSYWDNQTSGKIISAGGVGKNTSDMKRIDTFDKWDFKKIWGIIENNTYPVLRCSNFSILNISSNLVIFPLVTTVVRANDPFSERCLVYDPDPLGKFCWSLETNQSWIHIDRDEGIVWGMPNETDVGICWANVTVSNGRGNNSFREFILKVKPPKGVVMLIYNVYDLQNVSELLSGDYALANDINASITSQWDSGAGFVPIGNDVDRFNGSFDGRGYSITELIINRSDEDICGMFGVAGPGFSLCNISVDMLEILGHSSVGGLVGYCYNSTISNSIVNGSINGYGDNIGGLVGNNINGTVLNCTFSGIVNGFGQSVGGVVGQNSNGTISNCTCIGAVNSSSNYVGGFVGRNLGIISNCTHTGPVYGASDYVGGLVGSNSNMLNNVYTLGDVTGSGNYIGGLVGVNGGTVNNSYAIGNITGKYDVGGLGGGNGGTVNNSFATANVTGSSIVGGLVGENNRGMVNKSYSMGNVNCAGDYSGGLVGYNSQGTVNNSHTTANVNGPGQYVGGLVGFMYYGTVIASYASGNVSGINKVGGLVGENRWGTLDNSYASGNVIGTSRTIGGFVGYNNGGTVNNSHATGSVTGTTFDVGGLVGTNYQGSVNNSYATGNVTGWSYVGGLVGYADSGTLDNAYAMGKVIGINCVGGLIGIIQSATVSDSFSTGNVTGTSNVGGLTGIGRGMTSNSHYNTDLVLINGGHYITMGALFDAQYRDWFSNGLSLNISDYSANLVPSGDYFNIRSVQGLRDLLGFAGDIKYNFRLETDIDLSNASGLYVPFLIANFDGNNHTISNLSVNIPFSPFVGMFGYVYGGTIENTRVVVKSINAPYAVGGLVGYILYGMVSNSVTAGNVNGTDWSAGGLIGYSGWSTVSNSSSSVNVTGCDNVGGLVGSYEGGTMSDSYATGNVSGIDLNVGGLVGYNWGTVNRSYKTGNVTGVVRAGGLVGVNEGMVSDSYATGNVRGDSEIGGLVGLNAGTVNTSYAAAKVIGNTNINIGGLVGQNPSGTVINCFWDKEISGQSSSGGGTGKTTAEMKTRNTFNNAGWNFTSVWCMIETTTYPLLRWQETEPPKANAGVDRLINEDVSITLDGGSSSDNIGIVNYTWTFLDVIPVIRYGAQIVYEFDNPGIFVVLLKVTDAADNWNTDTIIVTVNDITPPSADAGPDRVIDEGTLLIFNGSGSSDNVGIVNYTWTFTDRDLVTLYGCQPPYKFNHPGIYIVELNITDAAGNQRTDAMKVTVNDITEPIADAGLNQIVDEGTLVKFNGNGSSDNIGIVKYTWTFSDGNTVSLSGVMPIYTFGNPGIFFITLNVTDAAGNWDTDVMNVTVNDITDPTANAGNDQTINEGTSVSFDGIGSSDNVGVVKYTWDFVDGDTITLFGARPAYVFDNPGVFLVTLNVTDIAGNWNTDTMSVTVKDITAPIADSGPNQTIDEDTLWTFDARVSSDNVGIVKFTWTFFDTSPIILFGVKPTHNFSNPGIFIVTLNVIDAAGNSGQNTMSITVKDITPPVADAGQDQRIPVGGLAVLNGSRSADNVGIAKYAWNLVYNGDSRSLEGKTVSFTFDKGGIYEVVLTVIDGSGNPNNDSVAITVMDTGRVIGTVFDGDNKPVKGATVEMKASNGMTCTTKTAADGIFLLDIYHGPFTWKISKSGYRMISGNSSVDPMVEVQLDLSDQPMTREENGGLSILPLMLVLVLVIAAAAGIGVYVKMKKGKPPNAASSSSQDKTASEGEQIPPEGSIGRSSKPAEDQDQKGEP